MRVRILLILIFGFVGCQSVTIEKEIYLIPKGFVGNAVIVYNQRNGAEDHIFNHELTYKIPLNGVLFLRGNQHLQEFSKMQYFYYEPGKTTAEKEKLCYSYNTNSKKKCDGIIWNRYLGSYQKNLESPKFEYTVIIIGTKDSIPPEFDPTNFSFR